MTSQRDWSALPNVEKFPETALMEKFERRPVSGFLEKKSFLKTPGGSGGLFFFFFFQCTVTTCACTDRGSLTGTRSLTLPTCRFQPYRWELIDF